LKVTKGEIGQARSRVERLLGASVGQRPRHP
jgi:hypothetical protein